MTRQLGLRFKEACLLDVRKAAAQARQFGRIKVTRGAKGGRGDRSDRWVPVDGETQRILDKATQLQASEKNLIPPGMSYRQWRDHAYNRWRKATRGTSIDGFHDMRAAYACERYQGITGCPAPVITGERQASKSLDSRARMILAHELGHNRTDVVAAYIGSSR
ncbi:MAG: integrase [Gammaproteobacteria bacterium]|nr:MAG: integrase [Gammaproteobacteria bacterium]